MSLLTAQMHLHFNELCQKILDMDKHIRFVGIINDNGRLITSSERDNIELKVRPNECELLYMETALRMRMQREFDHCLGPVDFVISNRRNFIITKIPFGSNIIYISADKNFDFAKTPFEINQILTEERIA